MHIFLSFTMVILSLKVMAKLFENVFVVVKTSHHMGTSIHIKVPRIVDIPSIIMSTGGLKKQDPFSMFVMPAYENE